MKRCRNYDAPLAVNPLCVPDLAVVARERIPSDDTGELIPYAGSEL